MARLPSKRFFRHNSQGRMGLQENGCYATQVKFLTCVPVGLSRSASVTLDHLHHGTSNEQMNPFPAWIHRFQTFRWGGGGGFGGSSRPWDKGGGGLQEIFFVPFGPHFGRKIRGGGSPGPLPWIRHCAMIRLISDNWSWSGLSKWNAPFTWGKNV